MPEHHGAAGAPVAVRPAPPSPLPPDHETAARRELVMLLAAARRGDEVAWSRLVKRLDYVPRSVARSFGLSSTDADDVVQATWIQLFKHIGGVREPAALPTWLATTARRTALRVLQKPIREQLTDDPQVGDGVDTIELDEDLIATELRDALARAIETLPLRHRRIMELLADESAPDYRRISSQLGVPIGSIGAIRGRSIARLERDPELRRLRASA